MFILGIDAGATSIKSGVVDTQGKIKDFKKTKNCFEQGENFLIEQLARIINDYKETFPIKKAGIGFAGTVNFKRGIVMGTANMGG